MLLTRQPMQRVINTDGVRLVSISIQLQSIPHTQTVVSHRLRHSGAVAEHDKAPYFFQLIVHALYALYCRHKLVEQL